MGQEQGKTTMSEPAFAETPGEHSLSIKNRFLLYENNYLRCINNLLNEIGQENDKNFQFSEPIAIEPIKPPIEPIEPDICRLPPVKGKCFADFQRWHYDINSELCRKFTYGGCGGNSNNFETEKECLNRCVGETSGELRTGVVQGPKAVVINMHDGLKECRGIVIPSENAVFSKI